MKKPLWGEHESYNPLPPPPRPSFWQGLGGTIKVVVGIALALAVIIGAAYLFAVYFPQIGSLTNPPAAPTATTAPTPTFTPLPTPTPTAQPTPSPTPQPSPSPSPSPTAQPSPSPTPQPSPTVMPSPTPARP